MSKEIKKTYFHIKGMRTTDEHDGHGTEPNYFCAKLMYVTGKGYEWNIYPVIRYVVNGVKMESRIYGLSVAVPQLREMLVTCSRSSSKKEKEAIELFDCNAFSAITHRLKYRVEVA